MEMTRPGISYRDAQHTLGIRTRASMEEMGQGLIPRLHQEIVAWLRERGMAPTGAPFLRFHVINMAESMHIEVGWPVAEALPGNQRIIADVLPQGYYASLIYTGLDNGMSGNKALLEWMEKEGLVADRWDEPEGDAFRARVETYLTDPQDEPDLAKWDMEVAIFLADQQATDISRLLQ